jgi:8-oxo-dGTP pyrophosphatase MutT (NUDIX family)
MPQPPETAVAPKLAATVLLLRETPHGAETLLVRRHAGMAFMGGLWVFPGGKLEPDDSSPPALGRVPPVAQRRCEAWSAQPGRPCAPAQAIGLYVAACRETFEEAGLLLAHRADGSRCTMEQVARLQPEREAIASRPGAFAEMLEREGLLLDGTLIPWAHWVTPSLERIRFDARFFATSVPADLAVIVDVKESTDHAWMAPAAALAAYARGEIVLAGPTIVTLGEAAECVAAHTGLEAMLAAEDGRSIAPILPRLRREGGEIWAYQPWDPEYASIAGEGLPPGVTLPERYRRFPSRMPLPGAEKRIVG